MSARENIAVDIVQQLKNMSNPAPGLVSRTFFDFEKLAITQFPAILVVSSNEERTDVSMSDRQGIIDIQLRCFVRGTELDTLKNNLIERIEETLENPRNRNITPSITGVRYVQTRIANIEVVDRNPPIGEVIIQCQVEYMYKRGNA